MTEHAPMSPSAMRPDSTDRTLTVVRADEARHPHVAIAGDTYTILVTGADTGGQYCLVDMYVPPGGGPPPHRHDFEEMFRILEGEIEVTFCGEKATLRAGDTANVPSSAPHTFRNVSDQPARMLCLCSPAGLEEFFLETGTPVASRTAPAPPMTAAEQEAWIAKAVSLSARYGMEFLKS